MLVGCLISYKFLDKGNLYPEAGTSDTGVKLCIYNMEEAVVSANYISWHDCFLFCQLSVSLSAIQQLSGRVSAYGKNI